MKPAQDETINWPPGIDRDVIPMIEAKFEDHNNGVNRRILLALLTMNSEKLFKACEDDPEAMFEAFKCSASTIGTYQRVLSLMDSAHARLMVALCGLDYEAPGAPFSEEDLDTAIEEAKAEDANEKTIWPALKLVTAEDV